MRNETKKIPKGVPSMTLEQQAEDDSNIAVKCVNFWSYREVQTPDPPFTIRNLKLITAVRTTLSSRQNKLQRGRWA